MAESELERAQKALRPSSDYYDDDDGDDDNSSWMVENVDVERKNSASDGQEELVEFVDDDDDDGIDSVTADRINNSKRSDSYSLFDHPFSDIPLDNNLNPNTKFENDAKNKYLPTGGDKDDANNGHDRNADPKPSQAPAIRSVVSKFDPLVQLQAQQQSVLSTSVAIRNLSSRIPAPNSLFDDDDSTAGSVITAPIGDNVNNDNLEGGMIGVELSEFPDGKIPALTATATPATTTTRATSSTVPGAAGYLEMEEEPPRNGGGDSSGLRDVMPEDDDNDFGRSFNMTNHHHQHHLQQEIRTDSGLVLTHRRSSLQQQAQHSRPPSRPFSLHPQHQTSPAPSSFPSIGGGGFRGLQNDSFGGGNATGNVHRTNNAFGVFWEGITGNGGGGPGGGRQSMAALQVRRFMSLVRIWLVIGALFVLITTGTFFHSLGHKEVDDGGGGGDIVVKMSTSSNQQQQTITDVYSNSNSIQVAPPQEILLLPLDDISKLSSSQQNSGGGDLKQTTQHKNFHYPRRLLMELRQDFETWIVQHNKSYHSEAEKERRFSIWTENHWRTHEKNIRHGTCSLTKQHVFGTNRFQDLAPEEFKAKYLTGYKGMRADELEQHIATLPPSPRNLRKDNGQVLDPKIHKVNMHESVRQRHLQYHPQAGPVFTASASSVSYGASSPSCDWYDVSCYLRWIWYNYGTSLAGLVGTMEPAYDSDSYPIAVDWRKSGAVTNVRTQGSCGACWAITAVETIESAHYIATGKLYDLSETEIIACDDSCEMCSGGWPQNAYSWTMKHGGLPLSKTLSYNADKMMTLTYARESGDEDTTESLRAGICPDGSTSDRSHDSGDENTYWDESVENRNYGDYSDQGRYGNIKGYGYATNRCLCYTDGSGCDCGDQDEDLAVRNLATYGTPKTLPVFCFFSLDLFGTSFVY